ncbi:MAG TPA: hypothetical protein PK986_03270 [Spirochaetota bacterium]|nr:hypothetical protein [Spirochaetota bacterium]HQO39468.1 hypothetical protein [Spirochaetota bacterium]
MNGRLFLVLLLMVYFSCGSGKVITDKPDGIITSASWPGTVKIISIGIPGKSCSGQKDYVDVIFDFTPDSADAAKKYLVKDVSDKNKILFYDNRSDLHKNWIDKWGLKTGNIYRAVRHENIMNSSRNRVSFDVLLEPR